MTAAATAAVLLDARGIERPPALEHGRFAYLPSVRRPPLRLPNDARVAAWVVPNVEYYPCGKPAIAMTAGLPHVLFHGGSGPEFERMIVDQFNVPYHEGQRIPRAMSIALAHIRGHLDVWLTTGGALADRYREAMAQ